MMPSPSPHTKSGNLTRSSTPEMHSCPSPAPRRLETPLDLFELRIEFRVACIVILIRERLVVDSIQVCGPGTLPLALALASLALGPSRSYTDWIGSRVTSRLFSPRCDLLRAFFDGFLDPFDLASWRPSFPRSVLYCPHDSSPCVGAWSQTLDTKSNE